MIKSKHRAVSLILVVILAMSAFCASGFSVFAASTDESSVSAGGILVYLKNTKNWNPVNVHYWGGSSATEWPGVAMNLVEGTTDTYYYEIPADSTGVIFNGGGNGDLQTGDLSASEGNGKIYDPSTNQWSNYSGPNVPTNPTNPTTPTDPPVPGDNVVYCQNDAGWSTVYCYMWNSDSDKNGSWPGVKMEDLGDGVWVYDIPKNYAKIIFNGGGDDTKTGDMDYPGTGRIYNNKTKEWDVFDTNPIRISGFATDVASPQYKGMSITITSNATSSGGVVSYKYSVTNTTTNQTIVLSNYGIANTVVWTPTAVGEYIITVDVIDASGNQNQRTMKYSIADDSTLVKPIIKSVTPYNDNQVQINAQVTVNVNAGGGNTGTNLLFYKYIVTDPEGVQNIPYYSLSKTYQFTPNKLGDYTVQVYVQGSDNQTVSKTYTYKSVGQVVTTAPTTGIVTTAPTTGIVTNPPTTGSTESTQPTSNPEHSLGDVDFDGYLTIKDVSLIQLHLAKLSKFTEEQKILADYDCDGHLNIKDATIIQFTLAGLKYVG